ncbi:hypothetical protein ACHAQA_008530 [Verticillium albo-atrum]
MRKPNILLFSKTAGFRHESIEPATTALLALATTSALFTVTHSEDAEASFTACSVAAYTAIVFLQCSGAFLTEPQLGALQAFVRRGGGVVAVHGAANGMANSTWYGEMLGAHFDMHPEPEVGTVVAEGQHFILGNETGRRDDWMDEWYNFKTHPRGKDGLQVILRGDTTTFNGSKMGEDHPLAWAREFDGGRTFYTALGHFDEAYEDEWFMGMLTRGILWASRAEDMLDHGGDAQGPKGLNAGA